jgi:hypothetical protein
VVTGGITLGGVNLVVTPGYVPTSGDAYTLFNNDLGDSVTGTFNGLANGATFTAGGKTFAVFYTGGDGNDVVLVSVNALTPTVTYAEDTAWSGFFPGQSIADADSVTAGSQPAIYGYDAFSTIQGAINAVAFGGTTRVNPGTYAESVTVNKSLSLLGPNAGVAGNGVRSAEAIIMPAVSGASPYSGTHTTIVTVTASNVTIKGFLIEGAAGLPGGVALTNTGMTPTLTNAMTGIGSFDSGALTGVDVSVYANIPTYTAIGGLTVQNNIIQDIAYQGIDIGFASNGSPSGNSAIDHNLIQNIGAYNDEGDGIRVYNNFYADIASNQISNVRMGVETGNFSTANPGAAGSINANMMTARRRGVFYNNFYGTSSAIPVTQNTINATTDDLGFGGSLWTGVYLISQYAGITATVQTNNINGLGSNYPTRAGYTVLATDAASASTISGGTVTNVNYGVWVTNVGPNGFGDAFSNMNVTISGVNISADAYGVLVDYNSGNGFSVAATVTGDNTITTSGAGTGVKVQGAKASAIVTNNNASIFGNVVGIDVNAGSAAITDRKSVV